MSPRVLGLTVLASVLAGGCIGWIARGPAPTASVRPEREARGGVPSSSTTTLPSPRSLDNPVLPSDFPDPDVVVLEGRYYAFATQSGGRNVQVSSSSDLQRWTSPRDALPVLPPWVSTERPDVWAPDVVVAGGRPVMAFTARGGRSGRMCIGLATSARLDAPFTASPEPLVCSATEGGAIDPAMVEADGRLWMYWKTDGNCCGLPVWIMVQELSLEARALVGAPERLLTPELGWESGIIEAPDPIVVDGEVLLLYSAGSYADGSYGVGLARCDAIGGPCSRASSYPLVASRPGVAGPGGTSAFTAHDGSTWVAYHSWSEGTVGYPQGARSLRIDPIVVSSGGVRFLGPS